MNAGRVSAYLEAKNWKQGFGVVGKRRKRVAKFKSPPPEIAI